MKLRAAWVVHGPVGFGDLKHVLCSLTVHCRVEQGENRGSAGVAGGEHPAETCDNEANQSRKQG
jgi:hypothetical protein